MRTEGNRTRIRLQFRNQTPIPLCRGFSFLLPPQIFLKTQPKQPALWKNRISGTPLSKLTSYVAPDQGLQRSNPSAIPQTLLLLFPRYHQLGFLTHTWWKKPFHLTHFLLSPSHLTPLIITDAFFLSPRLQASGNTQLLNSCLKLTFWLSTDI